MKTRVAKIVAERRIEIFEEEIPELKDNQILVQLKAVGICGSDLHFFRHCGLGSFKNPLPIDIGHEPAGIVIDSKSTKFAANQNVAIEPGINCGKCNFCHKGLHNLCANTKFLGANDIGAFRDYLILEEGHLFPIKDISYEKAALLEPLGVALHAIDRVGCRIGDHVAISGSGSIGLCIASVLKKMGCEVTLFDPLQYRINFALKYFNAHLNNEQIDLKEFRNKFQVVFDAVGTQDSITKAVQLVATGGEICIVGIPEVDTLSINPHQLRVKEVVLTNTRRSNQKLEKAYNLFKYDSEIEKLVTHNYSLENIQEAFEIAADYTNNAIKVMIVT